MVDRSRTRSGGGKPSSSPAPWEFPEPRVSPEGHGARIVSIFSVLFLFSALLALALVPIYMNRKVAEVQERIQNVLAPAERLAVEIELAQTKRLAALEAYLYSGNPRFRQRYRAAQREEDAAYDRLGDLTTEMDDRIWPMALRIRELSLSWHVVLEEALNQEPARIAFLRQWDQERARFDNLIMATRNLRVALSSETQAGLNEMARRTHSQTVITRILLIGVLAPLAVLFSVWWRLRTLMRETETYRRAATRARREADALLGATGDGVLGMDRKGRCRYLNRAGAELLGYPVRHLMGQNVHQLLHHTRADGTPYPPEECIVLRALDTGVSVSGKNEILWGAGGRSFPVQISVRPLKDGQEVRGAVLTFTDMTETRAAEESLHRAIRARDEVLAVVSHDLRNPVGTIFSSASLLLELNLPEEKRRSQLMSVKRAAGRMNRLIQDLLDVARIEAGGFRVAAGHFQLQELLDEMVLAYREPAWSRGIRLYSRYPDPYAQGWGDRDRIHQVLSNLVDNALKFSSEGGVVEIGAREEPGEGGVLFWVSDTGPGIEEEDQERLFDRFWQINRRDKGGAGLGLSIVKGLVEAHGGRVWVESEAGVGSTFLFLIPDRSPGTEAEG